uniref:asparagine synthase (glutamine-hydrolyzing) n=1 Tax=Eutreptiella gymnastica TaxID=73025 RepID=A0A6U7YM09_9EUGL|mmetsp:Transcript_145878/g.254674  ORF Transcript_145878/g.254674 Transcript_145878/m.254674 type:complete len:591 (+) Transcript_145878:101-1873(+)
MCGILAACNFAGCKSRNRKRMVHLAKRLRHRGPDWSSTAVVQNKEGDSAHYLCHERLAIVSPGEAADQPFYLKHDDPRLPSEGGHGSGEGQIVWMVNGEIYNHEKLKSQFYLHGLLRSRSDSEIVGLLYWQFGARMVPMLDGMYAFVLVDTRTEPPTILAARDHMGICPLYIGYGKDDSVWFSSEMKCLRDDVERYEIFPPGHMYYNGEIQRWYNPLWITPNYLPDGEADFGLVKTTLIKAVIKRLMTDVPCGVLLSGGLDSSLVTSIAVRHGVEAHNMLRWAPRMHTFSIGMKNAPDLRAARAVADHLDTIHHEFHFTVEEALDCLEDLIWHLESWHQVRASVPMYLLARKIKALGIKMVLSGEGADEIFAGYLYFHKCPSPEAMQAELVRKVTRLHQWDVLRANKSTQAWGLEARVPFLDKAFMDVSMNIDPKEKMINAEERPDGVHPRIEKYILRKAFDDQKRPYLPDSVLWRQKEAFSDGVGYDWVDGLKKYADEQISDELFARREELYPFETPETKEYFLLRQIFESHFSQNTKESALNTVPSGKSIACSTPEAVSWHKEWLHGPSDISGRAVGGVHVAGDAFKR